MNSCIIITWVFLYLPGGGWIEVPVQEVNPWCVAHERRIQWDRWHDEQHPPRFDWADSIKMPPLGLEPLE